MKKILILITVLTLSAIPAAQAEDLSWLNRTISWQDTDTFGGYPVIRGLDKSIPNTASFTPCNFGFDDSHCNPAKNELTVVNYLPLCESTNGKDARLDCLDSVSYVTEDGQVKKGEVTSEKVYTWNQYDFVAKPEYRTSASTSYQIFKFSSLSHSQGDFFAVKAQINYSIKDGKFDYPTFVMLIAPAWRVNQAEAVDCVAFNVSTDKPCWTIGSFTSDTRFTLSLKMAKAPIGWFTGRITDPNILISKSSDGRTDVSITGTSQAIPSINRNYHYTNPAEKAEWDNIAAQNSNLWGWDYLGSEGTRISAGTPFSSDGINDFIKLVEKVPSFNTADLVNNIWRVESSDISGSSIDSNCLKDGFNGIVTSNSMTYQNAVPTWDKKTESLVYSVASPHSAGGKEFVGRYDLVLPESVGKCLWKLNQLLPTAEISVTSPNGEKKVFTAASKIADGFYRFQAAGFTFSANKISIKMVTSKIKSTQITCVKGKVTKKVTTSKCPAGFKKK